MSFLRILPNKGGRNHFGRTTVRHVSKPKFIRFYFPFFNQRRILVDAHRELMYKRRLRVLASPSFQNSVVGCLKLSQSKYSVNFFSRRFSYSSNFIRTTQYTQGFSVPKLYMIPLGSFVYNVQATCSGIGKFARAVGSFSQVLKRRGSYVTIRIPSGEIRRLSARCFAFSATQPKSFVQPKYYKAGQIRNLGIRPHVRGCAMNPVDHPHGGRTGESRPSVSPWAQLTKGFRTRVKPINPKQVLVSVQQLKDTGGRR